MFHDFRRFINQRSKQRLNVVLVGLCSILDHIFYSVSVTVVDLLFFYVIRMKFAVESEKHSCTDWCLWPIVTKVSQDNELENPACVEWHEHIWTDLAWWQNVTYITCYNNKDFSSLSSRKVHVNYMWKTVIIPAIQCLNKFTGGDYGFQACKVKGCKKLRAECKCRNFRLWRSPGLTVGVKSPIRLWQL